MFRFDLIIVSSTLTKDLKGFILLFPIHKNLTFPSISALTTRHITSHAFICRTALQLVVSTLNKIPLEQQICLLKAICCRLFLRGIHNIDAQVLIFLFITTEFKENITCKLQMICITCLFEFLDFVVLYENNNLVLWSMWTNHNVLNLFILFFSSYIYFQKLISNE